MNRCKLLDIEMPLNMICPASKNYDERFVCYKDCGFSPLRDINKKIKIKRKSAAVRRKNRVSPK